MAVELQRFEMPNRLKKQEGENPFHGVFVAEPFECGFGYTVGNGLRRILLSSIEGMAVTNVKIQGVTHEFCSIDGVIEDVTEIILNVKQILIKSDSRQPHVFTINVNKQGKVTAGNIDTKGQAEVVNPDHVICTLTKDMDFSMELTVERGRGYKPADRNKKDGAAIDMIPVDAIFTPIRKVKYCVEDTRVGQSMDYDRLVVDVWSDGRIEPGEALKIASGIYRKHLDVFVDYDDNYVEFDEVEEKEPTKEDELQKILDMPISEIELSVRSANCIDRAEIQTLRDLVSRNEGEMLKYRNFGKKSLNEIKAILTPLGLTLGMKFDENGVPIEGSGKSIDISDDYEDGEE